MAVKKVLVVDFDPEFLKTAAQSLKETGIEVLTAADGQIGLEKFRAERPDLVILEAMLPKIHGFDLCSRITGDAARKAPVIIVSGVYRDAVYKTEALRTFGAAAYFEKPVDSALLAQAVRKSLGLPEPVAAPAAPPAAAEKPHAARKREMASDDIDNLLKDTLAEFGLRPEKKREAAKPAAPAARAATVPPPAPAPLPVPKRAAPAPMPEPARAAEAPAPAPEIEPAPAPKPEPPSPAPRPKPAPAAAPIAAPRPAPEPVEREPERPAVAPVLAEFSERPRKRTALYAALAGGLIVVAGLGFILFRGKKSLPETNLPGGEPSALNTSLAVPAEGRVELGGAAATDTLTAPAVNPASAPVKAKPSPRPAAERPQPTAESLRPVAAAAAPKLDLRVAGAPERPADKPAVGAEETPNPAPPVTETGGGANPAVPTEPAPQLPAAKTEPEPVLPAAIQPGQLVPLESVDVAPQVAKEARPVYPPMAMTMGIQGSVTINALVSETGDVLQVAYLKGVTDGGLDKAAETAVRKMKFTPARKNGINVRVWKPVTITFRKG